MIIQRHCTILENDVLSDFVALTINKQTNKINNKAKFFENEKKCIKLLKVKNQNREGI